MLLAVGAGIAISGTIAAFGKDILKEHVLAICDIAAGGTLNSILVSSSGQLVRKSRLCAVASVAADAMTGRSGVTVDTTMISAFEAGIRIREHAN